MDIVATGCSVNTFPPPPTFKFLLSRMTTPYYTTKFKSANINCSGPTAKFKDPNISDYTIFE